MAANKDEKAKSLKVLSPLVALPDTTGRVVYLYRGAEVPDGFDKDAVQRLTDQGMLGEASDDVVPGVGA